MDSYGVNACMCAVVGQCQRWNYNVVGC